MRSQLKKLLTGKVFLLFCILIYGCFIIISGGCKSRWRNKELFDFTNPDIDILEGEGFCELKKFQGTSINNIFFISWLVISNRDDYFFILESSQDGKKFQPCNYVKGNRSPANNIKLLFCYVDRTSSYNKMYYRIRASQFNQTISIRSNSNQYYIPTIMIRKNIKSLQYNLMNDIQ